MTVIQRHAEQENCWTNNRSDWTVDFTRVLWEKIGNSHVNSKFGGKSRNVELSWRSVYNAVSRKGEFHVYLLLIHYCLNYLSIVKLYIDSMLFYGPFPFVTNFQMSGIKNMSLNGKTSNYT